MKFCPECGAILEDKKICECGYNVETGEVDQNIRQRKNEETKVHLGSYDVMDNITGTMFVDEIPKNFAPNTGIMSITAQIKMNVSNYIMGMQNLDIENKLYELYKSSNLTKDSFNNYLRSVLELKTEEHIKNVISKIESEE